MDSTFYSHRESGFKNPKISGSQRIEVKNWRNESFQEVEVWWSRKLKKLKIEEVKRLKNKRIEEVEVWRSRSLKKLKDWRSKRIEEVEDLKFWRLNPSLQLELSLGGYWHGYGLRVPTDWYTGSSPSRKWTSTRTRRLTWRQRRKVLIRIRLGHL
jgi:hypothetical protein